MARLWSCGFELQTTTAGVEWGTTTTASPAIETSTVRSGAAALRINNSGAAESIAHIFTTTQGAYWIRVYFRIVTGANTDGICLFTVQNGSTRRVGIRIRNAANNNKLRLYNDEDGTQVGADSGNLSTDTWYRLEMGWDATTLSSTTLEARLYAASDEAALLWNPSGTANLAANPDRFIIGTVATDTTWDCIFDDVAINNSSGSYQNSWPGQGELIILRPDGAGDNDQWARGGADSGSDWGQTDEMPPNDATDYIESNTNNQIDDFTLSDTPSAMGTTDVINWVGVGARFAISSATGADPDFVLRLKPAAAGTVDETGNLSGTGSTAYLTNSIAQPFNYPALANNSNYEQPGTSSPWTKAALDAAQVGVRETVTDTHFIRVSALWVYVDHKPGAIAQDVSGGITPSGDIFRTGNKVLIGGNTPTGTVNKFTTKIYSGNLTPSGNILKQAIKTFSGSLSAIVGTLVNLPNKDLGGTVTSSGAINNLIGKLAIGSIIPSGDISKLTTKVFSGAISSITGALTTAKIALLSLGGTLTSSGALIKQTSKTFIGNISSIVGTLSKLSDKLFSGTLTNSGSVEKQANKTLSGTVAPSGSILKQIGKILSGILAWAGDLSTQFSGGSQQFFQDLAGTLTSSGTLTKQTAKSFAGSIASSGAVTKASSFLRSLSGTLTSSGTVTKQDNKTLSGNITPQGSLLKRIGKTLSGILTSFGDLATQFTYGGTLFFQSLDGVLGSEGSLVKQSNKVVQGTLITAGGIIKAISKFLSGVINSIGSLLKQSSAFTPMVKDVYLLGSVEYNMMLEGGVEYNVRNEGNSVQTINLSGRVIAPTRLVGNVKSTINIIGRTG